MTRVYITGKWSDKDTIREYMNQLEKLGHTIAHDWTYNVIETKSDKSFKEVQCITNSNIFIFLLTDPNDTYAHSFTELGVALGLMKNVYIICSNEIRSSVTDLFFHHPSIVHTETWDECLSKILKNKIDI